MMNLVPLDRSPFSFLFTCSCSPVAIIIVNKCLKKRERKEDVRERRKMNGLSLHSSFAPASRPTAVWFYIRLNWSITSDRLSHGGSADFARVV